MRPFPFTTTSLVRHTDWAAIQQVNYWASIELDFKNSPNSQDYLTLIVGSAKFFEFPGLSMKMRRWLSLWIGCD
jgi:hypothetical protein